MKSRLFLLAALAVWALSCSRSPGTGLYRTQDGFVRILTDSLDRPEAVFYRDTGALWADTVHLAVEKLAGNMVPYEEPEFQLLPERTLYREPSFQVGETHDVVYGRVVQEAGQQSANLSLDLYVPRNDGAASRPLLVMFHDGGFRSGDKRDSLVAEWCRHFASLGYVVSSVDYRLAECRTMEQADAELYHSLKDALASVRFLLKRDSLLIHPDRIFAAGMGAGGVIALGTAFMREEDLPEIIQEEEDTVRVIHQPLLRGFDVRAVANLWGAVADSSILYNARIPVISFHSTGDPEIPFGAGYPYEQQERVSESDGLGKMLLDALESILSVFLPEIHTFRRMYGSGEIDRILQAQGIVSELHAYDVERHNPLYQDDGTVDYPLFDEIKEQTARFFSSKMETRPVSLQQDPEDPQRFFIDDTEVDTCYWKVEGGVVTAKGPDAIRVLLFPEAPAHSVTVSGAYQSGLTFCETVAL